MEQTHDIDKQKEPMLSNTKLEINQEMTQSEMDTEDHELQEILDREHLDLEGFLKQGTMGGVESLPQEEFNTVQQLFIWKTYPKGLEQKETMEGIATEV